jgi:hypothetical protein
VQVFVPETLGGGLSRNTFPCSDTLGPHDEGPVPEPFRKARPRFDTRRRVSQRWSFDGHDDFVCPTGSDPICQRAGVPEKPGLPLRGEQEDACVDRMSVVFNDRGGRAEAQEDRFLLPH